MPVLLTLYQHDPFWLWLALAALCVGVNVASGSPMLMWPGLAAALVATLEVAGVRLGPLVEAGLFALVSAVLIEGIGMGLPRRAKRARSSRDRHLETARLVGRIARASSEFANGVGRVWIDGAEWGAELDDGGETLPEGQPVRVVRVVGGVRLQVRPLGAG